MRISLCPSCPLFGRALGGLSAEPEPPRSSAAVLWDSSQALTPHLLSWAAASSAAVDMLGSEMLPKRGGGRSGRGCDRRWPLGAELRCQPLPGAADAPLGECMTYGPSCCIGLADSCWATAERSSKFSKVPLKRASGASSSALPSRLRFLIGPAAAVDVVSMARPLSHYGRHGTPYMLIASSTSDPSSVVLFALGTTVPVYLYCSARRSSIVKSGGSRRHRQHWAGAGLPVGRAHLTWGLCVCFRLSGGPPTVSLRQTGSGGGAGKLVLRTSLDWKLGPCFPGFSSLAL